MVEELLPGLYRIEVPLPNSPLKALNSYVVHGRDRSLVVDTGMNREECLRPMLSGLEELGMDLRKTDFFITHLHADHLGLVGRLASGSSRVYFNRSDAAITNSERSEERWQQLHAFYLANGFPEPELNEAWKSHPGRRYNAGRGIDFHIVEEGDTIGVGDYLFTCVETKGHTPGHMCLYEAKKKVLLCGDCILFDITPNITFWPELDNSLRDYLASLEKLAALDVALVLPGHRRAWPDLRGRVNELKEHHRARLGEVLSALDDGAKTAFEVAPHVTWDIECDSWKEFPPTQKWFAIGETVAHLRYLEKEGKVRRAEAGGRVMWTARGS
ncbi:MAG: MBL fold metallo-hydrolase [Chloroflexota bacterium]